MVKLYLNTLPVWPRQRYAVKAFGTNDTSCEGEMPKLWNESLLGPEYMCTTFSEYYPILVHAFEPLVLPQAPDDFSTFTRPECSISNDRSYRYRMSYEIHNEKSSFLFIPLFSTTKRFVTFRMMKNCSNWTTVETLQSAIFNLSKWKNDVNFFIQSVCNAQYFPWKPLKGEEIGFGACKFALNLFTAVK